MLRINGRLLRTASLSFALIVTLTLAACSGGGSNAGAGDGSTVISASVTGVSGAPDGVVNQSSSGGVFIGVLFETSVSITDTVILTFTDPTGQVVIFEAPAPEGGGTESVGPIDLSLLTDGFIELEGVIRTEVGVLGVPNDLGGIDLDQTGPGIPDAVRVPATSGVPADTVSQLTENNVELLIDFISGFLGDETIQVEFRDGSTTIIAPAAQPSAGSTSISLAGLDLASLIDGSIEVIVTLSDPSGNSTVVNGNQILKDTFVPELQTAFIPAGNDNPQDTVTSLTEGVVRIDVDVPTTAVAGDTVRITIDGASGPIILPTLAAPDGGGSLSFENVDLSGEADGQIDYSVEVFDAIGNRFDLSKNALKDTLVGLAMTSEVPAGTDNAVNAISALSADEVYLDVLLNLDVETGDAILIVYTDGNGTTTDFSATAPSDLSTPVRFGPVDAQTLIDGLISITVTVQDSVGNTSPPLSGQATKDTIAPNPPTAAIVPQTANNPAGFVNAMTTGSVTIEINYPEVYESGSTALVAISDGTSTIDLQDVTPTSGTTMTIPNVDLSAFVEGALTIRAWVRDSAGNNSSATVGSATKDVSVVAVTAVTLPQGTGNPAGFVNSNSQGAVDFSFTMPAGALATDVVESFATVGASTIALAPTMAPQGGAVFTLGGQNLAGLSDGLFAISGTVIDVAGNTASFGPFTGFEKDSTAPGAVTGLSVAAGASNNQNEVNLSNVALTFFDIIWPSGLAGNEQGFIELLSSGGGTLTLGPIAVPTNGGSAQIGPFDLTTLPDGTIAAVVNIDDPAGNRSPFTAPTFTKDTNSVVAPSSAFVQGSGVNAQDVINSFTVNGVVCEISLPATYIGTESVFVILSDISNPNVQSAPQLAPNGGGTMAFTGIDVSSLDDGPIALSISIDDGSGPIVFAGDPATKDTTLSSAPSAINVAMTAQNPLNFVNATTAGAATISVQIPADYDGTESISVTINDSVSPLVVTATQISPVGPALATFTGVNISALNDGNLALFFNVTDSNGNQVSFNGTSALKDVVLPDGPNNLGVAAGAQNAINVINEFNLTATELDIDWANTLIGDEIVDITMTSNNGGNLSLSPSAPAGGGIVNATGINSTPLADGTISIVMTLTDPAGNVRVTNGTPATKDSTDSSDATSVFVAMGSSNPQGFINAANVGAVTVTIAFDPNADPADTVTVKFTDDMALTIAPATAGSPNPGGTINLGTFNLTALDDGFIVIEVTVEDALGNTTTLIDMLTVKDVVAPTTPSMAQVPQGSDNPEDTVNALTEGAVTAEVVIPGDYAGDENVFFRFTQGPTTIDSTGFVATATGLSTENNINLTALADGAIGLDVVVTDPAGNITTLSGDTVTKDTVLPVANNSLSIDPGANNDLDVVNIASVGGARFTLAWDASLAGDESVTFALTSSGGGSIVVGPVTPTAGASISEGPFDLSGLSDGVLTIEIRIEDPAGNIATATVMGAIYDITAPASATAAEIASGANNAADIVNLASQGAAEVSLTFPNPSDANDTYEISISDVASTNVLSSGTLNPPALGGTLAISSFVLSGLLEGNLNVVVTVTDAARNPSVFVGDTALKDTIVPATITSAQVAMTANNPIHWINEDTMSSATVTVDTPTTYDANHQLFVQVSDGTNMTTETAAQSPSGGGATDQLTYAGINAAALADGVSNILISVRVVDGAGNQMTYAGLVASKDIVDPDLPTAFVVASGASNAQDVVNENNQGVISTIITWGAAQETDEDAVLTASSSGGGTPFVSASFNPSAAAAADTLANFDGTAINDGNLTLALLITDPAGNVSNFSVTNATKDATDPDAPSAAHVAVGATNPIDGIDPNNNASATVTVDLPNTLLNTDTVFVVLSDGVSSTTPTAIQSPTGGVIETLTFNGIDATSLNEGLIDVLITLRDSLGNERVFSGTQATKSLTTPDPVTAANVAAIAMTNPVDWINSASASSFSVDVLSPATYLGSESVVVTISDGTNMVVSGAVLAPAGGGTMTFTSLNAAAVSLADSLALVITVDVTDGAGNSASFGPFSAMKDTVDPDMPQALNVKASAGVNAIDFIDSDNVAATVLSVQWGASQETTDSATVAVTSTASATSASLSPSAAGATDDFASFDTSALADSSAGGVGLVITVTDLAGNTSTFNGTSATKDTTAPDAATAAIVTANLPAQAQNVINSTNATAVELQVTLPATTDANDTVSVTLTDGGSAVATTATIAGGNTTTTFATIDVSGAGFNLSDGSLAVAVVLTDEHGNTMTYPIATPVLLDTVDPAPASTAIIASGANNPADFINIASESTVSVDVGTPASYTGVEMVTVVLSDGANMTTPATMAANGGAETLTFTGIDTSSLNEGAISILVDVVDSAQNSATQFSGSGTKDVGAPDLTKAEIPANISNPLNLIGPDVETAVTLRATFSTASVNTDTFVMALTDGSTTINIPATMATSGAGNVDQTNQDLSSLADGDVTMTVTATDLAGNQTVVTADLQKFSKLDVARVVLAANKDDDTVTSYLFDTTDGTLFPTGFRVVGDEPVDLALAESGGFLFVANQASDNISAFTVNRQEALLIEIAGSPFAAGTGVSALAVDRSASVLAAANTTANNIEIFTIDGSGVLASAGTHALGSAVADVTFDPSGRFVFACSAGMLHSWTVDRSNGALTNAATQAFGPGILRVEVHPSGRWAYVISEAGATIDTFDIDQASGALSQKAQIATGTTPSEISITPNGATVFVSNVGSNDTSMYDVNSTTGLLVATAASPISTGGVSSAPSGAIAEYGSDWFISANTGDNELEVFGVNTGAGTAMTVSSWPTHSMPVDVVLLHSQGPAGVSFDLENVYVANQASGDLSQFTLNDADGTFSALAPELVSSGTGAGSQPAGMVIHPTGEFLYIVNGADDSVSQFAIGQVSGTVSLVSSYTIPTNAGGGPPRNPGGIAMSPTGLFLFVTSRSTGEVVPFAIDPSDGDLVAGTPVSTNGTDPTKLVTSTSGKFLYVLNSGSSQVEAFGIDLASGALASVDTEGSLNTAANLAVHPSGKFLYVVTNFFGVKIFDVDSATGALTYNGAIDATTGNGANSITTNPSGTFAYVVNRQDSNVSSYTINISTGALSQVGVAASAPIGPDARNITIDPLGRYAYVTDFAQSGAGTIYLFDINSGTGALTANATQPTQSLAGLGSDTIAMRFVVQ
ncbi:MAG: beta-propeller fold lactonase family protein [Planctomycetota bacterium]